MMASEMMSETRRGLLLIAGAAFLVAGWQRYMVRPVPLDFQPIPGAAGWHFATAGEVSGLSGADVLTLGLDRGPEPLPLGKLDAVVHRDHAGGVPVAVFSDFFCPFCRTLIARIERMAVELPAFSVSWHELPLLGPNSELAARALEAAALQGGYADFHAQLLVAGFRPLPAWMREVAGRAGLDGPRLEREMDGPRVAARLAESAAAAARLGLFATPGTVFSRRVVLGALDRERFADLIETA